MYWIVNCIISPQSKIWNINDNFPCDPDVENQDNEYLEKVAIEKQKAKTPKPIKIKTKKATGEREMFLQIWSERPHYCINCGKYLGEVPKASFFSHRKAKSVNNSNRLNPDNIDLLCFDCHFARDMQGQKVYENRSQILQKEI